MKKYLIFVFVTALIFVSCEDQIVSECNDEIIVPGLPATFTSIQNEVFTPSCAISGCHVVNSVEPLLSAGQAYSSIANIMSSNPPFPYVYPSRSDNSYIINKIRGINIQGERMPLNRKPLSSAVIDSIAAWIDQGALNN